MLHDRASSEKTSGRRARQRRHRASLFRATTMMMRRACRHLQESTSSIPRQPTGAILDLSRLVSLRTAEMKIVGTSPPNTSIFFPRHTGLPDVSELASWLSTRRCNCTDQPQPLCDFQVCSRHQYQINLLPPTSLQLQLIH